MSAKRVISFDMGSRNMAYALVEEPHTLICWGMIDLGVNQTRQATENLLKLLETEPYKWMRESDYDVVVEQQPASGVCRILAHVLQAYFRTSDFIAQREKERGFHFMSPNNKLKFDVAIYDEVKPETHSDRKIVSMRVVEQYVDRTSAMYSFYASRNRKQQTDLADAYIQGCREVQPKAKRKRAQYKPSHFPETSDFNPNEPIPQRKIEWDFVDFVAE